MGKSLSLDIRERVVSLVEGGFSCHEAARRFRISAASAVRIMQRKKRTGSATITPPKPTPGQSGRFGSEQVVAFSRNRWPLSSECADKGARRAFRVAASPSARNAS